jgi:hypothetical protein
MKVFCVLRSGGDLNASDVARLQICLKKHLPGTELHCLSDVEVPCTRVPLNYHWPKWWSKMEMFRPDIKGDIFYLDLDTVVVGDISHLVSVGRDTMLSDFYYPWRSASGMMYLTEKTRADVWEHWIADPEYNMRYAGKGDQVFLATTPLIKDARIWQRDFPGQIISFKRHMRPSPPIPAGPQLARPPSEARIVCFHGIPRPTQIEYEPWVREAWSEQV